MGAIGTGPHRSRASLASSQSVAASCSRWVTRSIRRTPSAISCLFSSCAACSRARVCSNSLLILDTASEPAASCASASSQLVDPAENGLNIVQQIHTCAPGSELVNESRLIV
jgi:hypothetical protein